MTDAERKSCDHCGALIEEGNRQVHQLWHLKIEPDLERPSSEFGFWDQNGRWNENSEDW